MQSRANPDLFAKLSRSLLLASLANDLEEGRRAPLLGGLRHLLLAKRKPRPDGSGKLPVRYLTTCKLVSVLDHACRRGDLGLAALARLRLPKAPTIAAEIGPATELLPVLLPRCPIR
jgi:hypothetical protein